ncbi:MAG: hypothetical protein QNJ31_00350 [Candidatus Caenarcaniphilales bacterium]|nr:hypothetical protein [Candidatus Caenarcaniphilales bacterium]
MNYFAQQKRNILLLVSIVLILLVNSSSPALDVITSDWKTEAKDEEKRPVSAIEFETRESRLKALEQKKVKEEILMEELKADINRRRKKLVECLNEKGVTLFSIEDCDACKVQKAYFGEDFEKIKYVDCNKSKFTCPFRGIKSYPTWYLGNQLGIKKEGVKDLPTLSKLTNCEF